MKENLVVRMTKESLQYERLLGIHRVAVVAVLIVVTFIITKPVVLQRPTGLHFFNYTSSPKEIVVRTKRLREAGDLEALKTCSRTLFEPYSTLLEPHILSEAGWEILCRRSISHLGTLTNMHKALRVGMDRGVIKIGVTGGSVSVGTRCDDKPEHEWYNTMKATVNTATGLQVEIYNVAQGGTGADRALFCFDEFLRSHGDTTVADLDIVILEYAINDGQGSWAELLIRRLLPFSAIMFLETFSIAPHTQRGFGTSQMQHDALARYYDVPVVSARDALLELFRQNATLLKHWFHDDAHHPTCFGHVTLGVFAASLIARARASMNTSPSVTSFQEHSSLGFLDISDLRPPSFLLESNPHCMLATPKNMMKDSRIGDRVYWKPKHGLSQEGFHMLRANNSWNINESRKPSFDCTHPMDGELVITINCAQHIHRGSRDFCQILFGYTRSWRPMGTATVTANGTKKTLDGYEPAWSTTHWTLQQYTDMEDPFFRVPDGQHNFSISCTGSSSAGGAEGNETTLFKLESIIIL